MILTCDYTLTRRDVMPVYGEVYSSRISSLDNTQDQIEKTPSPLNLPDEQNFPAETVGNPGAALTSETIRRQADAAVLCHLIARLVQEGISWSAEDAVKISMGTAESALMFFQHLPASATLPKISPDGEGGLMAVWEMNGRSTLVIIDNFNIHLATGATTPEAQYFPELVFDGEQIPDVVLKAITR